MIQLDDKQSNQVNNILNTLIEATDHFSTLTKKRELNQSIFLFSSIVEGFESINKLLETYEITKGQDERIKIEQYILMIARELEKTNFIKIAEIIQFSLSPQLRKLKDLFSIEWKQSNEQKITIGVYFDYTNPRNAYPEERIHALLGAAEVQNVNLIFFSSSDVDLNKKEVIADVYNQGTWQKVTTSLPDIIHNIGVVSRAKQSITDRKLRRIIPFTSFYVGNKFYLPKKLVKYKKYADLLAYFKVISNKSIVFNFLASNNRAVLKPILGRRGENIYFVKKRGNDFVILDHKQEHVFGKKKFEQWLQEVILKKKNSYMIQKYIESRTIQGEPYDIRAHMQKNGEGKWQITRIYPRIGNKKSILSNISRGGRSTELDSFLVEEFGEKGKKYAKDLRELSINLTHHLDKLYGSALDELGLDLTIDKTGRFWLHEVNNGPQSTYHENERAETTIAYAIYLAKNGIANTNEFQNMPDMKGQFNSRASSLEWADLDNRIKIGMLVGGKEETDLAIACAYVANYEGVNFYVFRPQDIDFDEMLIRGKFYENKQWVEKIVEYPDVIYDRFRLRGVGKFNLVYQELDGIPFTNEFYGNSISKLDVYNKLQETGQLNEIIIPYQKVTRIKDIINYILRYNAVIVKPEVGSFARGVHLIEKLESGQYIIADKNNKRECSELALTKFLRDLLEQGSFLVQKYIESRTNEGNPFDIRVHMMKDENNEWDFVTIYPRIGLNYATIMSMNSGGYTGKIIGFLQRNYPNQSPNNIEKDIKASALKVTNIFSSLFEENFNEIAFDFALDKNATPYLIEVNVNKPGITVFEFNLARYAIPNAIHIAKQHEGMTID